MASDDDERRMLPDGHRYEAPEPEEETKSKSVGYAVLGALVLLIMVLIATGTVQIFDY